MNMCMNRLPYNVVALCYTFMYNGVIVTYLKPYHVPIVVSGCMQEDGEGLLKLHS